MRFFIRVLTSISSWLDKRFPQMMTTSEVNAKLELHASSIIRLENEIRNLKVNMAKIKMLSGIAEQLGVGE